jgi:aerobic-type carbon monoxide dehydrogenase small subunit (CoxS/CutS family)
MIRSDAGGRLTVILNVNGQARSVSIDANRSLPDVIREELPLTVTKKGCVDGKCVARTIDVGGQAVLSCMPLSPTLFSTQRTSAFGTCRSA